MNAEIEKMSDSIAMLKRELDKHRSANLGSRSNTCSPSIFTGNFMKNTSIQLPSILTNNNYNSLNQNDKANEPTCIMFTRIDADRNNKRLKRVANRGIISEHSLEVID